MQDWSCFVRKLWFFYWLRIHTNLFDFCIMWAVSWVGRFLDWECECCCLNHWINCLFLPNIMPLCAWVHRSKDLLSVNFVSNSQALVKLVLALLRIGCVNQSWCEASCPIYRFIGLPILIFHCFHSPNRPIFYWEPRYLLSIAHILTLFCLRQVHTAESNPILISICCEVRWFLLL